MRLGRHPLEPFQIVKTWVEDEDGNIIGPAEPVVPVPVERPTKGWRFHTRQWLIVVAMSAGLLVAGSVWRAQQEERAWTSEQRSALLSATGLDHRGSCIFLYVERHYSPKEFVALSTSERVKLFYEHDGC